MKRKSFFRLLSSIVVFIFLVLVLKAFLIEPWLKNKIEDSFNEKNNNYQVHIENLNLSIFKSGIKLETITLENKTENNKNNFNASIESIVCNGFDISEYISEGKICIGDVIFTNSKMHGWIPFRKDSIAPSISSFNIVVDNISFDNINLQIGNTLSEESYSIRKGTLKISDIEIKKNDTLSAKNIKRFTFNAEGLGSVTADSMYTFEAIGLNFANSNTISIDSFYIHSNFDNYEFTSRHKFQTDCINAEAVNFFADNFSISDFLKSGHVISSFIKIDNLDMNVFRDRRKPFEHVKKPMFQELMYDYQGRIKIDSIQIVNGTVTYTEHAERANHPGKISFNQINANIYKITNDTVFKKDTAYLEFKSNSLLMGKGSLSIQLRAQLFEKHNTFSMNGRLSAMEMKEMNPIIEKNAFIYAVSGKVNEMNFSFSANNHNSTGKMRLLYQGLDVAVKNEVSDDTTAVKEKFESWIANMKIADSNPLPGKDARLGFIAFERDPEKSIFNYCAKSILSGIKSSLNKSSSKKKASNKN